MKNFASLIKRFAADEEGATMMEYSILLGLLMVAVITVLTSIGGWVNAQWTNACVAIKNGGGNMNGAC